METTDVWKARTLLFVRQQSYSKQVEERMAHIKTAHSRVTTQLIAQLGPVQNMELAWQSRPKATNQKRISRVLRMA